MKFKNLSTSLHSNLNKILMIKRIDIAYLAAVSFSLTALMSYTSSGQSESIPYLEIRENKIFIHSNNDVYYLVNDKNSSFLFENYNESDIVISFQELIQLILNNSFKNRWFDFNNFKPLSFKNKFLEKSDFIFENHLFQFVSYVYNSFNRLSISCYKSVNPVRAGPAFIY